MTSAEFRPDDFFTLSQYDLMIWRGMVYHRVRWPRSWPRASVILMRYIQHTDILRDTDVYRRPCVEKVICVRTTEVHTGSRVHVSQV